MIANRKGSFDLYGLDFVLDFELNPWLLEARQCPSPILFYFNNEHNRTLTGGLGVFFR